MSPGGEGSLKGDPISLVIRGRASAIREGAICAQDKGRPPENQGTKSPGGLHLEKDVWLFGPGDLWRACSIQDAGKINDFLKKNKKESAIAGSTGGFHETVLEFG